MGAQVEITDTGTEVEIHKFDTRELAKQYLMIGRGYKFDRHEDWAFTTGFDFYNGPIEGERATLRNKDGLWQVCFWINGDVRVIRAMPYEGKPVWNGSYRLGCTWFLVTNDDSRPIAYMTDRAAFDGAKFTLDKVQRATVR